MKKTPNLGLSLYESSDKFAITASENSLNHNMELIDSAITETNSKIDNLPLSAGLEILVVDSLPNAAENLWPLYTYNYETFYVSGISETIEFYDEKTESGVNIPLPAIFSGTCRADDTIPEFVRVYTRNTNTGNTQSYEVYNPEIVTKDGVPTFTFTITAQGDDPSNECIYGLEVYAAEEATITNIKFVSGLTLESEAKERTIYLVPNTVSPNNNIYDEYIIANGKWELIGSTAIDLTEYVTNDSLSNSLKNLEWVDFIQADEANISTLYTSRVIFKTATYDQFTEDDIATKDYVDTGLSNLDNKISSLSSAGLKREIVETLPELSGADESTIYMVGPNNDSYEEYMVIKNISLEREFSSISVESISINGEDCTDTIEFTNAEGDPSQGEGVVYIEFYSKERNETAIITIPDSNGAGDLCSFIGGNRDLIYSFYYNGSSLTIRAYKNGSKWELIGSTAVDLSNYATKNELPKPVTVDTKLSSSSTNPVQNKVINHEINILKESLLKVEKYENEYYLPSPDTGVSNTIYFVRNSNPVDTSAAGGCNNFYNKYIQMEAKTTDFRLDTVPMEITSYDSVFKGYIVEGRFDSYEVTDEAILITMTSYYSDNTVIAITRDGTFDEDSLIEQLDWSPEYVTAYYDDDKSYFEINGFMPSYETLGVTPEMIAQIKEELKAEIKAEILAELANS